MKDTPCAAQWGLRNPSDFKSSILREEGGPTSSILCFLADRCSARVIPVVSMNLCVGTPYRDDTHDGLSRAFVVTWRPRACCAVLGQ